ncbi:hypothetical protein ELI41_21815 [Rhizobium leguminosarum]|uniref:EH signature domain-containing protein n=1 Tax=Rhizobium leguminosarum TaxID=384 RepID=UPI00102F5181|nr:EH signature domain-containing protein [Rhizobium leguminosarum]TAU90990.1 hypothetical protein ELI41_21815 [Rhizobium leguminosarum]
MTLLKALSKQRQFTSPALPSLNPLRSGAERIMTRWPDVVANPPEKDREKLVTMVREKLERDDWEDTKLSLITSAGRALFDEDRRDRPDLAGVRDFYFRETRASTRAGFLSGIFSIYMDSFDAEAEHTWQLAGALSAVKGRLGARWRIMLDAIPEMLAPDAVADAIARQMVFMDDLWTSLQALGIRSPHAPGLMNAVHLAYVKQMEPHLDKRAEMERLIEWLKPVGREAKTTGAGEALSALLGHWVIRTPSADDLRYLTENIIGIYGDPRVQRGGVWSAVPEPRLAVILRWLTGENIRFFLDVVSAVEDSHMWEPRRKFWLGLHTRGRVDAAWVAFSDSAQKEAMRRSSAGRATLAFGKQTAGYGRANTSLLVLKVGRKIIVEGSHSYKVHIFDESNQKSPALYQRSYDCEQIRLIPGAKSKSHNGDWQSWVLEQI